MSSSRGSGLTSLISVGNSVPTLITYYDLFFSNALFDFNFDVIFLVIVVHNSELLAGALDKSIIGSGSKSSIFYIMLRDFGEQVGVKTFCKYSVSFCI